MSKIKWVALMAVSSLFAGCAFNVAPYGAGVKNVEAIKAQKLKPVSVGKFQSSTPGKSSLTCRAAGPVTVNPSFEAYIEKAFIDELSLSGAYDPSSPIVLTGKLDQVDFSSGMSDGNWTFVLTLSNAQGQSYTTQSRYDFSGAFVADKACQLVAQAYGPAVQKLIGEVAQNPKLRQIAK